MTLIFLTNAYIPEISFAEEYTIHHWFFINEWTIYTYHNLPSYYKESIDHSDKSLLNYCNTEGIVCKSTEFTSKQSIISDWWKILIVQPQNHIYWATNDSYILLQWEQKKRVVVWDYTFIEDDSLWTSILYLSSWYKEITSFDLSTYTYELVNKWGWRFQNQKYLLSQDKNKTYINSTQLLSTSIPGDSINQLFWDFIIAIEWEVYISINWIYISINPNKEPYIISSIHKGTAISELPVIRSNFLEVSTYDDTGDDWWVWIYIWLSPQSKNYIENYIDKKSFNKEKVLELTKQKSYYYSNWISPSSITSENYDWLLRELVLAYVHRYVNTNH